MAYDIAIVGGGFFGCHLALVARSLGKKVVLLEKESTLMQRASLINQARIHQGYHYPRSILTALSSRENFALFLKDYQSCICDNFTKLYAIAKVGSKTTAKTFESFCKEIKAPLASAPSHYKKLFNSKLIEQAYVAQEYAFDSSELAKTLEKRLANCEVDVRLATTVDAIHLSDQRLRLLGKGSGEKQTEITARKVLNCTYSGLNKVLFQSSLQPILLKHELTEVALVEVPSPLKNIGITVMDGEYFSVMPFPVRKLHSLTHVRYTPHASWYEGVGENLMPVDFEKRRGSTNFSQMILDAQRYLPGIATSTHVESLWEVKTLLPKTEFDDGRPILCFPDPSTKNLLSILGGKIDNIYDIANHLHPFFVQD